MSAGKVNERRLGRRNPPRDKFTGVWKGTEKHDGRGNTLNNEFRSQTATNRANKRNNPWKSMAIGTRRNQIVVKKK